MLYGNGVCSSTEISVVPARCHIASSASSISTEPRQRVQKDFNDAYTRRGPPHTPMMTYIGIRTASKNT